MGSVDKSPHAGVTALGDLDGDTRIRRKEKVLESEALVVKTADLCSWASLGTRMWSERGLSLV